MKKPVEIDVASGYRGPVDITRLDAAWNESVTTADIGSDEVTIDLSDAQYIDHESFLYLIALIAMRDKLGQKTSFVLPKSEKRLEALRCWDFFKTAELVSKSSFRNRLNAVDQKRLANLSQRDPYFFKVVDDPNGGRESLLSETFFALTPVQLKAGAEEAASIAKAKWLDRHVLDVLNFHLDGYGDRIATNVIYEGVLNAGKHPGASIAFTGSQLLAYPKPTGKPVGPNDTELVISIWDDGQSFADTLLSAYERHGTVASPAFGLVEDVFEFDVIDRQDGSNNMSVVIESSSPIDQNAGYAETMLSAFFLGTSSTPSRIPVSTEQYAGVSDAWIPAAGRAYPGLGLHIIRKTVVDQFGGSLFYASGRYRLTIQPSDTGGGNRYVASMSCLRETDAQLAGNLLIIRIALPAKPTASSD